MNYSSAGSLGSSSASSFARGTVSRLLRLSVLLAASALSPHLTAAEPVGSDAAIGVPSGVYGLDKTHGYITFSYSHLGFSNPEVGFNDFDVDLNLVANDLQNSKFSVAIDASSIDSRVAEFDKHLRSEDYFDVANHPTITFTSSAIEETSANTANISGVLTIKGVAKPITLAAVLNKAGMHPLQRVPAIGVSATATISRSDWGLSKYVPMVGDEVTLSIEVELPRVPQQ